MKKSLSILGALIFISSVMFAGGIENPLPTSNMAIVKTGDVVKVFYKSEKVTKVTVTIYNENNKKIFSESVKNRSGFIRPYNLSNLPQGEYRVVMKDENETSEKTVSNIPESSSVWASIINARKDYNKCLVTLFSKSESEVNVRMLDEKRNVLVSENYTVNGQSSKLFNIENLKGAVSIEVYGKNGLIKSAVIE